MKFRKLVIFVLYFALFETYLNVYSQTFRYNFSSAVAPGRILLEKAYALKATAIQSYVFNIETPVIYEKPCFPNPIFSGISMQFIQTNAPINWVLSISKYSKFNAFRFKSLNLNYDIGIGITYTNTPYSAEHNYLNNMLGSRLNAIISGGFETEIALFANWSALIGLRFNHISNGEFKKPNFGLNYISLPITLLHKYGEKTYQPKPITCSLPKNIFEAFASFAWREVKTGQSKKLPVYVVSIIYHRNLFKNWYLGLASDVFYDKYNSMSEPTKSTSKPFQFGISSSLQLVYGNTAVEQAVGYYYLNADTEVGNSYNRLNIKHYFNRCFILLTYSRHKNSGYYIGTGLGFKL